MLGSSAKTVIFVLADMASPEYSRRIDKKRKNQTRINKQNKEEFLNIKLPDPTISLPKYYEHPEVREFVDDIISKAEDQDARVTGDEISRMSNFVLEYITLKSCMRIEVPGNMTPNDFYLALESPQVFFPFRQATVEEKNDPKLQSEFEHRGGF